MDSFVLTGRITIKKKELIFLESMMQMINGAKMEKSLHMGREHERAVSQTLSELP